MFDPMVKSIHNVCSCFAVVGACLGGIALGTVLTPITMTVGIVALPILGVKYWMENRNHQWLYNKTVEIYKTRLLRGPSQEKNYMENVPTPISQNKYSITGKPKFNCVKDLTWLWYEYHRLGEESQLQRTLENVKRCSLLLIPIVGFYLACMVGKSGSALEDDTEITPIQAVKAQFHLLRDKLQNKYLNGPDNEYGRSITNTLLEADRLFTENLPDRLTI